MKRTLSISLTVIFFLAIGQGACKRKKPINANSNVSVQGGLSAEENRTQARAYLEEGKQLYISESTTKTHISKVYEKLGAANRAQALMTAMRLGLIKNPADTGY